MAIERSRGRRFFSKGKGEPVPASFSIQSRSCERFPGFRVFGDVAVSVTLVCALLSILVICGLRARADSGTGSDTRAKPGQQGSWYFAVSGDSRDCGDLIVPKIAKAIHDNDAKAPVQFYWHLGDLRRMFGVDCDIAKRTDPSVDCAHPNVKPPSKDQMTEYLGYAWDDFIDKQIKAFGSTQYFLGIGNHELLGGKTRDDFRKKFQAWLTEEPIHSQWLADQARGLASEEGDTYYHFVKNGVDFIYLDNADTASFSAPQVMWLGKLLKLDAEDPSVKTIIVGMHEALPFSKSRDHAMDMTCQGICSGQQVYDLLFRAQNLSAPPAQRKHVYVFCSHDHYYQEDIFNTPEHQGQVLPGWLVGTAGAQQYTQTILYGYLQVEIKPDGTLNPQFKEVSRDSAPVATGAGAAELTDYCFKDNKLGRVPSSRVKGECACGAVK